jgi:hypothetical protein
VQHFDTAVVDGHRVNAASRMIDVPVPWTRLAILVGGSITIMLLTTAAALLFLRSASDPDELRTPA